MKRNSLCAALALMLAAGSAQAAIWSSNEVQYQRGSLDAPSFASGRSADTDIFTFQHASGWKYVDLFFFVDVIDDDRSDGFNDSDVYGELYLGGGFGKLSGSDMSFGPFKDIGWVIGYNRAQDAKVQKWLPGLRLYWEAPGFAFLNTDITAYIDDSSGVARGGAPRESDSFMVDFSWAYPFKVGDQDFSIEGHAEYIDSRTNEFGGKVSSWILAQPQFRWDAGKAFWGKAGHFYLGVEFQFWWNKLGDPTTDETAAQFLAVWKF